MPLTITDVQTDAGGDTGYVTTTITGAGFNPKAIVKLIRPGFAEIEPVTYQVVDATKIIAEFDLGPRCLRHRTACMTCWSSTPTATRRSFPTASWSRRPWSRRSPSASAGRATSSRATPAPTASPCKTSATSTRPYTYFTVGIPEMGINIFDYGLHYVHAESNVSGGPTAGSLQNLPWATLNSNVDLGGTDTTSGYLVDEAAGGFTGFTFNVDTYPALKRCTTTQFDVLKQILYTDFPALAKADILKDGPDGLEQIQQGLSLFWDAAGDIPDLMHIPGLPFQFNIVASATSMTRQEFVNQQLQEADQLRTGHSGG